MDQSSKAAHKLCLGWECMIVGLVFSVIDSVRESGKWSEKLRGWWSYDYDDTVGSGLSVFPEVCK